MACIEEIESILEELVLPSIETTNNIILEHAYSEEQASIHIQNDPPDTSSSSSSSMEDVIEESVVNSIESVVIIEQKPVEIKIEQVQEKVKSRELKSLLDAAKESNLDTNIDYKRRPSQEPSSSQESGGKRAMRSQNPDFIARHKKFLHKVSKFELNPDGVVQDSDAQNQINDSNSFPKTPKRKKESFADDAVGGSSVDDVKKSRKSLKVDMLNINMKKDKDSFCWRCHREGILVQCETCPRGYHPRCLKQPVYNPERWPCPECLAILQAESTKTRSPAMRDMSLEHLCELLKYAAKRMINCAGSEPFIHPVDIKAFPDYQNYVVQPMDLTTLQSNIRNNVYGSTVAFMADAKWILHNSIIYNSYQSKLTSAAKSIIKICKQEMSEIETCSECYQNANTKKNSWFVEVCSKPHILLWAKLKGFPYWPAKAMTTNAASLVDVRFFGAHDRAWIPIKECFLYSKKDPNTTNKNKRNNIAECIKEVDIHIEKLKEKFGEFYHAPYRTPYDPTTELEQLAFMLPKYIPSTKMKTSNSLSKVPKLENGEEEVKTMRKRSKSQDRRTYSKRSKSRSRSRASSFAESNRGEKESISRASSEVRSDFGDDTETLTTSSKTSLISDEKIDKSVLNFSSQDFDKFMEGYGTEDDESLILNNKARKNFINYDSESDEESSLKILNSGDSTEDIKNGNDEQDDDEKSENISETSILSRGKVRTRGGYHNVTGKVKVLGSRISESSRKRSSTNSPTMFESPVKLSRRNSDISTKSDSSRISGISDKINKVEEFSDMLEVSLGNSSKDTSAISSTEIVSPEKKSRPEFVSTLNKADLVKLKPVIQVSTGDLYTKNKEFRISPQNKSVSIADRLMKKITQSELSSEVEKIESVKKQILDSLESSTSSESKDDSQNNEDVSSTDNSEVKKPEREKPVLEKKDTEINEEISKDKDTSSSDINIESSDKNQNVSSSTESTNIEPEQEVSDKTKDVIIETIDKFQTNEKEEKVVDPPEKTMGTEHIEQSDNNKAEKEKEQKKLLPDETPSKEYDKDKVASNDRLKKDKEEEKDKKDKEGVKDTAKEKIAKEKDKKSPSTETKILPKPITENKKPADTSENNQMDVDSDESETSDEVEESDEESVPLNKINKTQVKIVNVSDIISGKTNSNTVEKSKPEPSSTSTKSKPVESTDIVTESIEIKSEPASEEEDGEPDLSKKDSEKPLYDVTLTVVDKQKKAKIEENNEPGKLGFKVVDNMTRIIDSVASNYSKELGNTSKNSSLSINRKEITLKPISKLMISPKQKARKSFPNSPHKMQIPLTPLKKILPEKKEPPSKPTTNVSLKVVSTLQNVSSQISTSATTTVTTITSTATATSKDNMMYITPQTTPVMSNMALLPPNQPITLTQSVGSQILAMVHSGINTPSLIIQQSPSLSANTQIATQNSSQCAIVTSNLDSCTSTTSLFPQPQATEQISQPIVNDGGSLPESISKSVGDLLCKPPPRLKPRPPGPLSNHYDEGSPSSAGPTSYLINSISHRLTDYFRGLLKETLQDLSSIGDPESKIRSLELELETLKHKHAEEMLELRKNISSILKDIQKSMVEEKAKIVDETRAACEAERLRSVEEAKSKQWCAFCSKEAQFYCCWNTSYCDYPCQQKHWATHMKTCSQTTVRNVPPVANNSAACPADKSAVTLASKPKQTYANNQKTVLKSTRMIVKQTNKQGLPMYVPVQRPMQGGQQTITLVESTPGNFEIVGNHGPISLGGKLVPTTTIKVKPGNLITVASTSNNNTSTTGSGAQKTIILSQKSQQIASKSTSENKT